MKGIHLTVNRMGRPSGQAFIEMDHEEDVSKALEKHRQYLGPRYVEGLSVSQGHFICHSRKITGVNDKSSGGWIPSYNTNKQNTETNADVLFSVVLQCMK